MRIIELKCLENQTKPKVRLKQYNGIRVLIDTGADTPVWCASEEKFKIVFPEANDTQMKFIVSGFGSEGKTKAKLANVFKIEKFRFGTIDNHITFRGMYVAISEDASFGVDLILPNSIFKSSRLIFDYLGKEEILRMENRFDQVFLWYEPIDLTEEMIRLYREHYHLSDEEILTFRCLV